MTDEELSKLVDALGGSEEAMRAIDYKRGPAQQPNPHLDKMGAAELGQADRYTWGAEVNRQSGPLAALLGTIPIAGYEGVKAVAQSSDLGLGSFGKKILGAATMGAPDDTMELNERTSPASLQNIISYIKGALRGDGGKAPMPASSVPQSSKPEPKYLETRMPGDGVPPEVQAFLKSRGK